MKSKRFIATGPVPLAVEKILGKYGRIQLAPDTQEGTLIGLMEATIGLIVRGTTKISAQVISAANQLRVIGRSGVGCENIDLSAATACGIPVIYTPGAPSKAVAEGALAMILSLVKKLPELDRRTKLGDWTSRDLVTIRDMEEAILGIVGFGQIGTAIARMARSFDMRILANDPYVASSAAEELGVKLVDLDSLFSQSDYIALVAPLTAETRGIVNRRRLTLLKNGAILVNLGRGALLENLDDVYEALQSRRLAALGLDVFPTEPPDVSHPIFSHSNVLCTPHAMGLSGRAVEKIFVMMSNGMAAVLEGSKPKNVINPEVFDPGQGISRRVD